jgi:hypothetical protein
MLDRLINVTVSALFGAFVFAFCILVWSASSCEPPSEKQASATQESSDHISCETFNVGFFKRLGIIIALHPNETAAAATAAATAVVALFTLVLSRIGRQQARDARVIQRAHVFPLTPQHQFLMNPDGTIWGLRLWVPWKNSGATPASPVNSFIGITWVVRPCFNSVPPTRRAIINHLFSDRVQKFQMGPLILLTPRSMTFSFIARAHSFCGGGRAIKTFLMPIFGTLLNSVFAFLLRANWPPALLGPRILRLRRPSQPLLRRRDLARDSQAYRSAPLRGLLHRRVGCTIVHEI